MTSMQISYRLLKLSVLAAALLAGGLFSLDAMNRRDAGNVERPSTAGSGALDGMRFSGQVGPLGKPGDVTDSFVFADGLFLSTECEKRCDFPARPYFVRHQADGIDFVSKTRCPTKNALIEWRGTVDGDRISGEFTWTVERWYWTIEKTFWFEGTLAEEKAVAEDKES